MLVPEHRKQDTPHMRTISASHEIVRVANQHLRDRGLPELSAEQAEVVGAAIGRWYGIPVGTSSVEEMNRMRRGDLR